MPKTINPTEITKRKTAENIPTYNFPIFSNKSVVELGFQPALVKHYVYPGCRFALPRAGMSCAFSAR
jgi:hypothetical protein